MEINQNGTNNNVNHLNSQSIQVLSELPTSRQGQKCHPDGEGICAFAPDESSFAWYCGFRKVVVVPWDSYKNCLDSNNEDNYSRNSCGYNDHRAISLDCGFAVCSLAFGIGTPEDQLLQEKKNYWTRFDYSQNLMLATGHNNGRIRIWNPHTGKLLLELTDHKQAVKGVAFAPDGTLRLVSCSDDGTIKVWDLSDDGNLVTTLCDSPKSAIIKISWSPNAKYLCSVGLKQKVLLWNMSDCRPTLYKRLSGHLNDVLCCCFSPDGALVATASRDTTAIIWDVATGTIQKTLYHVNPPPGLIYMSGMNDYYVTGVSFAHNGFQLATTCSDGILRLWDLSTDDTEPEGSSEKIENDGMLSCGYSPSGRVVAVSFSSGSAIFYASNMKIPSLTHIGRMAIRKQFNYKSLNDLCIPATLISFLRYERW